MVNKKLRILFVFVLVFVAQTSCRAPEQQYPTLMPTAIYANVPNLLVRGEKNTFSINTVPEVECHAGIGYYNFSDKWITVKLPTIESDQDGVCEWTWEIPQDAKDGIGEFRGYIQEEDESTNVFPENFCIESCR